MKKKLLTLISVVGLSFSLAGGVGAAPIESTTVSQGDISVQNIKKNMTIIQYYSKQEYKTSGSVPTSYFYSDNEGFYGSLKRTNLDS